MILFLVVSSLQGILMIIDEGYFHRKRGLPKWEKWGHPLDTLTVIFSFSILSFFSQNSTTEILFWTSFVFSCIFVVKDEIIHYKVCEPGEMLLHGFLFILHPITLYCGYLLWGVEPLLLKMFTFLLLGFFLYQVIYWSNVKNEN